MATANIVSWVFIIGIIVCMVIIDKKKIDKKELEIGILQNQKKYMIELIQIQKKKIDEDIIYLNCSIRRTGKRSKGES